MVATLEQINDFLSGLGADIPRPWLKSYPQNINANTKINHDTTLLDLFDQACTNYANNTAYSFMGEKLSYANLNQRVNQFAAYLLQQLQVKPGSRVGIMLPNSLHFPVVFFGILRAGMTAVTINPLYTKHELTVQLQDAQCNTLIVLENSAHVLAAVIDKVPVNKVVIARIGDFFGFFKRKLIHWVVKYKRRLIKPYNLPQAHYFKQVLRYELGDLNFPKCSADQLALIQYTGGTSGVPKGVMLSHGNLASNAKQCQLMLRELLSDGPNLVLGALPFYHIYALMICSISFLGLGAECVLVIDPRQQNDLIKILKNNKLNVFVGINTLFKSLLANPKFSKVDASGWEFTITGGMALEEEVHKQWQQRTDTKIIQGYGLSEASPVVSVNLKQDEKYNNSIGMPLPGTDVCLLKMNGVGICDVNEPGELCVRGPQVMQGYWQKQQRTATTLIHNWLLTGDVATMDADGQLSLVDRKKDMIIVSGFNVYPAEVEAVLLSCPGIVDAAVIGKEDEDSGEAVHAYLVKADKSITDEDIIAYADHKLSGYKVPSKVIFIDKMPRSPIGKLLRRKLREEA